MIRGRILLVLLCSHAAIPNLDMLRADMMVTNSQIDQTVYKSSEKLTVVLLFVKESEDKVNTLIRSVYICSGTRPLSKMLRHPVGVHKH